MQESNLTSQDRTRRRAPPIFCWREKLVAAATLLLLLPVPAFATIQWNPNFWQRFTSNSNIPNDWAISEAINGTTDTLTITPTAHNTALAADLTFTFSNFGGLVVPKEDFGNGDTLKSLVALNSNMTVSGSTTPNLIIIAQANGGNTIQTGPGNNQFSNQTLPGTNPSIMPATATLASNQNIDTPNFVKIQFVFKAGTSWSVGSTVFTFTFQPGP
jgi:hypothetical protein